MYVYVNDERGPQNNEFIHFWCVRALRSSDILLLLCVIASLCIDSACHVMDVFVVGVLLTFSLM